MMQRDGRGFVVGRSIRIPHISPFACSKSFISGIHEFGIIIGKTCDPDHPMPDQPDHFRPVLSACF
jgi:hypothetical protein